MIEGIVIFLSALWGAQASRMTGGGWPSLPRIVDLAIWGLPFGVMAFFLLGVEVWIAGALAVLMGLAKSRGHTGLDMGRVDGANPGKWYAIRVPGYRWLGDALSMAMNGGMIGVPVAALLAYLGFYQWAAAVVVLSALSKPAAYELGWRVFKHPTSTEFGEYLFGALIYTLTVVSFMYA